jgi:hypothetical protein
MGLNISISDWQGTEPTVMLLAIFLFSPGELGLDPDGNPIPIIWGAKVTGQAGKWNIGFQNIMDKPDDSRNFTVASVTRNIGNQSYVGILGTNGNALSERQSSWLVLMRD